MPIAMLAPQLPLEEPGQAAALLLRLMAKEWEKGVTPNFY